MKKIFKVFSMFEDDLVNSRSETCVSRITFGEFRGSYNSIEEAETDIKLYDVGKDDEYNTTIPVYTIIPVYVTDDNSTNSFIF